LAPDQGRTEKDRPSATEGGRTNPRTTGAGATATTTAIATATEVPAGAALGSNTNINSSSSSSSSSSLTVEEGPRPAGRQVEDCREGGGLRNADQEDHRDSSSSIPTNISSSIILAQGRPHPASARWMRATDEERLVA